MVSKEIVVAKYKEDVTWADVLWWPTFIYDKDPEKAPESDMPHIKRILVNDNPYYGREAHSYLLHIIEHYDNLPDVTYFLQGSPFEHYPFIYDSLNMVYNETVALSFYDPRHMSSYDVGDRMAHDVNSPVPSIMGVKHINSDMEGILRYSLASRWKKIFAKAPIPGHVVFAAGAQLAVPRWRIHQRSKEYYQYLLHHLITPPFELDAWVLEMFWLYIFGSSHLDAFPHTAAFRSPKMMG